MVNFQVECSGATFLDFYIADCCIPGDHWQLKGKVSGDDKIFIDFAPKGGPKDLTGVWEAGKKPGIRFPDGNKWTLEAKP